MAARDNVWQRAPCLQSPARLGMAVVKQAKSWQMSLSVVEGVRVASAATLNRSCVGGSAVLSWSAEPASRTRDMSNHLDKERGPLCETRLYQKRMAVLLVYGWGRVSVDVLLACLLACLLCAVATSRGVCMYG